MKRKIPDLLLVALLMHGTASAGPHDDARFVLHATDIFSPTKANPTPCSGPSDLSCPEYNVQRPIPGGFTVFLVVANANEVGIIRTDCGIDYAGSAGSGIDPNWVTWSGCTDGLEFPNAAWPLSREWPWAGGGLQVVWQTCQNQVRGDWGVHAVIGSFYVYAYSEDVLRLIPDNNHLQGPQLDVVACGGGESDLFDLYPQYEWSLRVARVHFGGDGHDAYNPCIDLTPIRPTTWGRIKNRFLKTASPGGVSR